MSELIKKGMSQKCKTWHEQGRIHSHITLCTTGVDLGLTENGWRHTDTQKTDIYTRIVFKYI